jgi:hypothetical protein
MTKIKIKNSTTASGIPTSGSLLRGELAVNIADQRIFIGDASGNPVELTSQTVVSTSGTAGVASISSNPSGIYVSQSTGAVTLGLVSNVFVSGALHVSGVIAQSPASLNLYASEDPVTNLSRMINMKSYGNNYGEINVTDDGVLSLSSTSNIIELRPSGVSTVQLDSSASTGYIFLTPTNIYIGGSSAVTTLPGDVNITKTLTVDHIHGDLDGAVLKQCKNTDSITLRKGDPVFIAGTVGASDVIEVQLARSDTTATMPAVGLSSQDLAVNATGHITLAGVLYDVDTSAFSVGSSVFVNSTGWITSVRPTGASILVQNIGRVGRVNSSNGQIIVSGPGRANGVPNTIAASGTLTLGTPDIITPLVGTASVFNTNVARLNIGSSASGVLIGNATGVVTVGDIAVNNGSITTTAATATLFNATSSRVNIGGGASGVQIGHPTGTVVMGNIAVNSGTISTTALAGDIFNATAARINIGAAASGVKIGNATGVVSVGDIAVNNGAITTTASTATLFNATASRVNIGAGASGVLIGHATGVVTVGDLAVNDGTISTTATGVSIFDATALRVNIGGGASGVQIGHPTGTVVMGNIAANSGTISTIAVNSGNISTTATSASIFNANALSLNIGGGASGVQIGHPTGTVVMGNIAVNSGTISTTALAGDIFNATAARINIGAAASGVKIGNATGVVTVGDIAVNNGAITTTAATATLFNATASRVNIGAGASGVLIGHATGVVTVGDLAVNDGTISTTATGVSIFDATALRVNIGGGASGVQIGHPTGTVVMGNIAVNSGTISTTATSANIFNTTAARVNIGAGASGVLIGNATGVVTVGDVAVNNGAITTTATTATLFNATASRVNIGGGASGVQIGHPTGMIVMGNIAVSGSVNTDNILSSGSQLTINDKANNRVAIGDYTGNGNHTYVYLRDNASILDISNPFGNVRIGDPTAIDTNYFISYSATDGVLNGGGPSSLTNFSTGSFGGLLTASGISATGTIAATFNGLVDMNFNTLVEPTLKYYNEVLASPSISANVLTLDLSTAQVFTVSLNANITTFTISNTPATANRSIGFTLIFTADGTARTVTWGSAVKWANNDPPALTSTNGKKDILSFVSPDNGTNWYGFIGGLNF